MVEVASQVAKPDYLSLVNKGGSGFNVSELVTSIVAAEIQPNKILQNQKEAKNSNAISGIGFLNSQTTISKTALTGIQADKYFSVTSSNIFALGFKILYSCKSSINSPLSNSPFPFASSKFLYHCAYPVSGLTPA